MIYENGENLGVMYTREAMEQANELGLNLVEVSPGADPPVCKFLDVGKYRYEAQKKANAQRKTQKTRSKRRCWRPGWDSQASKGVLPFVPGSTGWRPAAASTRCARPAGGRQ